MFNRTPQSKLRSVPGSDASSAAKRKRDTIDGASTSSNIRVEASSFWDEISSPSASEQPYISPSHISPGTGKALSLGRNGSRANASVLRKIQLIQAIENESDNRIYAAHLCNSGDLLLVRRRSLSLHQDILGSYNVIEIPLKNDTQYNNQSIVPPFIVDLLSLQNGQRCEVVTISPISGTLQLTVVDSDGHVARACGSVRLLQSEIASRHSTPIVSCLSHLGSGTLLLGTSDEQVHVARHSALAAPSHNDVESAAGVQCHLLQQRQKSGFLGLLESGKRLLGMFGTADARQQDGPAVITEPTRHGGRPAVRWQGDETNTCPTLRVLTVSSDRVLAVGAMLRLWSGVGESGAEQLEWAYPLFREAFNAANGRDAGDEGGYEGQYGTCLVDAALLPADTGVHRGTLVVLALSRAWSGAGDSAPSSPEVGSTSCEKATLWLLQLDVPLGPNETMQRSVSSLRRLQLSDTVLLAGEPHTYLPTLHVRSTADTGEGDQRSHVMVSWVSTTGAHTLHVSTVSLDVVNSSEPKVASSAIDTGVLGAEILTCAQLDSMDGLVALRDDGSVLHLLSGPTHGRRSPRPGSPRSHIFDSLLSRGPALGARSAPADSPDAAQQGKPELLATQRLLHALSTSQSTPGQDLLAQLRTLLSQLSPVDAATAVETACSALVDRAPAGQHWGAGAQGKVGSEYHVALQTLEIKAQSVARLSGLLSSTGLSASSSALTGILAKMQTMTQAARGFCEALRNAQMGSLDHAATYAPQVPRLLEPDTLKGAGSRTQPVPGRVPSLLGAAQSTALPALSSSLHAAVRDRSYGDYEGRGLSTADAFFAPVSQIGEGMLASIRVALSALDERADLRSRNLLATGVLLAVMTALRATSFEGLDSIPVRELLLEALQGLRKAIVEPNANSEACAQMQWWRDAGGYDARGMLQVACTKCIDTFVYEAERAAPADMQLDPAHGAHMSESWRRAYHKAKRTTSILLLRLASAEVSFALAARDLDFDGLLEAVEAAPEQLRPKLVELCGRHGTAHGTESLSLVEYVLRACEDGPGSVRPGRLQQLLDIGKQQPETFAVFLQSRPHLRWHHALQAQSPSFIEAANAAKMHATTVEASRGYAGNMQTLASIAKLAAVVDLRQRMEPESANAARTWEATLLPYDNMLSIGKAQQALASLSGERGSSAMSPSQLLQDALDIARTIMGSDNSTRAADAMSATQQAQAALERVRTALGVALELLLIVGTSPQYSLPEDALAAKRAEIWGMSLRCQEGLWGHLAAQRCGEQPLSAQEDQVIRGTVFYQLLAVLKDGPVAEQTVSASRMQERWTKLSPHIDALAHKEGLDGTALFLVRAAAGL